jgi:hypothetical protein
MPAVYGGYIVVANVPGTAGSGGSGGSWANASVGSNTSPAMAHVSRIFSPLGDNLACALLGYQKVVPLLILSADVFELGPFEFSQNSVQVLLPRVSLCLLANCI